MEPSAESRELLRRCGRGDERALAELIARYESRVFRVAARSCGDAALAEEATIETFYKVWKSAEGWNGKSSPDAWIFKIAVRTTKDLARARKRWWNRMWKTATRGEADSASTPVAALENAEESDRAAAELNSLIQTFSDDDRTLVALYYWEEMPLAEIAPILDASVDALKMRLARLRKKLARMLEPPDVD